MMLAHPLKKQYRELNFDLIEDENPKILERKKTVDRILSMIIGFVEPFVSGFAEAM